MSLAFLSKKSFHTTNIKNVEKVWIAEQKAEQEEKKVKEFQKQLQKERELQELRQLQNANGVVSRTVDNSLEWMYQGPASELNKQESAEEFLLGKIYKGSNDKGKSETSTGFNAGNSNQDSSKFLSKVATKNELFTRLHEDPFLRIKQEEKKRMDTVLHNPIKMDRIRGMIAKDLQEKELSKKVKKEAKKQAKKDKKTAKKERKKRDRSPSDSRSRSADSRPRRRHDSESSDDSRKLSNRHPSDAKGENFHRMDRSPQRTTERHSRNQTERRFESSERGDRCRDESRDRHSNHKRHRSGSPADSYDRKERYKRESIRNREGDHHRDDSRNREEKRFGLIKKEESDQKKDYLGPRPELLKKKQEEEKKATEERMKARTRPSEITEEERLRRIKEMEVDAELNDKIREDRLKQSGSWKDKEKESNSGKADFLRSMRSEVYTSANSLGIQERIDQNKHYRQKSVDMEGAGFMKR